MDEGHFERLLVRHVFYSDWQTTNKDLLVEPIPYLSGHAGTGIVKEVGKKVKWGTVSDKVVMS